jgi:hypothetical protein
MAPQVLEHLGARPRPLEGFLDWEKAMRGARYHEAGHAVAAYHHGYTIKSVTATADDWSTNWGRPLFGGPAAAWRDACVTLAGQLAEDVAAWGEIRPEPWEEFLGEAEMARELVEDGDEDARDDHLWLLEILEEMVAYHSWGDTLEACYRQVVEDTRRLLSEYWSEVEAVARALEPTGTLDGAGFKRAVQERAHA